MLTRLVNSERVMSQLSDRTFSLCSCMEGNIIHFPVDLWFTYVLVQSRPSESHISAFASVLHQMEIWIHVRSGH